MTSLLVSIGTERVIPIPSTTHPHPYQFSEKHDFMHTAAPGKYKFVGWAELVVFLIHYKEQTTA